MVEQVTLHDELRDAYEDALDEIDALDEPMRSHVLGMLHGIWPVETFPLQPRDAGAYDRARIVGDRIGNLTARVFMAEPETVIALSRKFASERNLPRPQS